MSSLCTVRSTPESTHSTKQQGSESKVRVEVSFQDEGDFRNVNFFIIKAQCFSITDMSQHTPRRRDTEKLTTSFITWSTSEMSLFNVFISGFKSKLCNPVKLNDFIVCKPWILVHNLFNGIIFRLKFILNHNYFYC